MLVYIISCGKAKRDYKTKAEDMYIGDYFKMTLKYSKLKKPDKILILSTKYNVLELDDIIEPYDAKISNYPKQKRLEWKDKTLEQLKEKCDLENDTFVLLASKSYIENITPRLKNYSIPTENLSMGFRKRFYKQEIAKLEENI